MHVTDTSLNAARQQTSLRKKRSRSPRAPSNYDKLYLELRHLRQRLKEANPREFLAASCRDQHETLRSLPPEEAQTTDVWNGIRFEFGRGWWVDSGVLKGGGRDGPKAGSHSGIPGSRPSKERAAAPWPQIGESTFGPTLLMRDCIWRVFFD